MNVSSRAASILLAVVATALTVTGIVLAATDSNPSGNAKDPLALNGYPPKTAQIRFVVSTGQEYNVTADVNVNFVTNAVQADLQIPMFFSSANVEMRLVHGTLFAGSANLSSIAGRSWVSTPVGQPSLYGLSLEMTKPDISLISGFTHESITKSGYLTTYDFQRDNVVINHPSGLPFVVPKRASVDFSITVGRQGELTASSFSVTSTHLTASVQATVLSYNQPATIVAPPAHSVKKIDQSFWRQIFGSSAASSLLDPKTLTSLGQMRLS